MIGPQLLGRALLLWLSLCLFLLLLPSGGEVDFLVRVFPGVPVELVFSCCCSCWAARDVDAASIDLARVTEAETDTDEDEDEEPPERRPFLRGGWSSDEAPVAAAFLLFLSILSPLRTAQQQAAPGSASGSALDLASRSPQS